MTTTLQQDDHNKEIQISVPSTWGPIMSILGMNNDEKMPEEETDLFMIRQFEGTVNIKSATGSTFRNTIFLLRRYNRLPFAMGAR
jgi:hypothetical protein